MKIQWTVRHNTEHICLLAEETLVRIFLVSDSYKNLNPIAVKSQKYVLIIFLISNLDHFLEA